MVNLNHPLQKQQTQNSHDIPLARAAQVITGALSFVTGIAALLPWSHLPYRASLSRSARCAPSQSQCPARSSGDRQVWKTPLCRDHSGRCIFTSVVRDHSNAGPEGGPQDPVEITPGPAAQQGCNSHCHTTIHLFTSPTCHLPLRRDRC